MATPSEVRNLFEAKLRESTEEFHPADLERVKDDKYLQRILKHHDDDVKLSADMLWEILTWRKNVGASDINESSIRMDYIKDGGFFPQGRDIDGHLLLVFRSKLHVKGQKDSDEIKKCVIYWFDRLEREEHGKSITLFFDMDGCGLGNMDMEFTKYLILLMKLYYPSFLHYIIIHQMPWVLTAAFKVIKQLLPARAVEKMKFTTKDNVLEFVPSDQALVSWGGQNEYVFEFVPESGTESVTKKVTFAEQGDTNTSHSPGELLKLTPSDHIQFKNEGEDIIGQVTIKNMDESTISFKIRTTAPEKFRVRPSSGTLTNGASQVITITLQPTYHVNAISKDRFLVMAIQIPKDDLPSKELAEIWQKTPNNKVDEYRLRSQFPEFTVKNGATSLKATEPTTNTNKMQSEILELKKQVNSLRKFQILTLVVSLFILALTVVLYKDGNMEGTCNRF